MTLQQKVGQMILTGVSGTAITQQTCNFLQRVMPGGIIYTGSNVTEPVPEQLKQLSSDLQNCMAKIGGIRGGVRSRSGARGAAAALAAPARVGRA